MTEEAKIHQDDCLMCAVRALTEGVPPIWQPREAGESVSGVVLQLNTSPSVLGPVPYVDLWRGGYERIRVMAHGAMARHAIDNVAPKVGDTFTMWFDGQRTVDKGPNQGRTYKMFSANVQRGH